MALNFPSSPANNEVYIDSVSGNRYVYNGAKGQWIYSANSILQNASGNQVLYKNNGDIAGSPGLTFDPTANVLYANSIITTDGATFGGDLHVTGNLTIVGNATTIRSNSLFIGDSVIHLAANNTSDLLEIGFVASYANGTGANVQTGLYRDQATKEYYLFQGFDVQIFSNTAVTPYANNMVNAVLNADLITSNLTLGSANAIVWIKSAYDVANSIYNQGNDTFTVANSAFDRANQAEQVANSGYTVANAAFNLANGVLTNAAAAFGHSNTTYAAVNSAFGVINSAYTSSNAGYTVANAAYTIANTSFNFANGVSTNTTAAFGLVNTTYTAVNSAFGVINAAFGSTNTVGGYANTVGGYANQAGVIANAAFGVTNSSYTVANAAFSKANNALANTSGVTFAGNLYFPATYAIGVGTTTPTAPFSLVANSALQLPSVAGALIGDFTGNNNYSIYTSVRNSYQGISASSDVQGTNDAGDYIDMGIDSSVYADPTWTVTGPGDGYLYVSNNSLALGTLALANINFFIGGQNTENQIARFSTSGLNIAAPTLLVSGTNVLASFASANNYAGAMANAANAVAATKVSSVSGSSGRISSTGGTTPVIDLATSGVTATTYGGATQIPVLNVDAYGRITGASNTSVQGMDYAYANNVGNNANNFAGTMANASNSYASATYSTLTQFSSVFGVANAAFAKANTGGGSASINIGASPPGSPVVGNLWWDTVSGQLYIYYTDVDSSQWVEATGSGLIDYTSAVQTYIYPAYDTANAAFRVANAAFGVANQDGVIANAAFVIANAGFVLTNTTYTAVNSAFGVINAAFGLANTALQNTNVTIAGNLTSTGVVADSKGDLRNLPINTQSASYTLVIGDNGKMISTNNNITVPNAVFSPGNVISIFNNSSASNITVSNASSVTMYLGGTTNTMTRSITYYGLATIVCVAANTFFISGAGVS